MAKTIKFNLICDGHPVRTLEDLREHFSIEDVLFHYKSGMLARWLDAREYKRELEAVNSVQVEDDVNAAKALVQVFEVEIDHTKIEEIGYLLKYEAERKEAGRKFSELHEEKMWQLKASLSCYQNLKQQMSAHRDNFAALKADVAELHTEYMTAFELDYRSLFYYLKEKAPAAIYMMLAYDEFREKYLLTNAESASSDEVHQKQLPSNTEPAYSRYMAEEIAANLLEEAVDLLFKRTDTESLHRADFIQAVKSKEKKALLAKRLVGYHYRNPVNIAKKAGAAASLYAWGYPKESPSTATASPKEFSNDMALTAVTEFIDRLFPGETESASPDTAEVFKALCDMTTNQNLKFIFEGNYDRFHVIKRNTNGNWDDMIDRKQKCMVLWMAEKCEVRPSGCRDVCYKDGDVKNQFMLLDGVDYRSQLGTTELLVLEV